MPSSRAPATEGIINARVVKGAFDEERERSPVLAERSPAVALDGPDTATPAPQWIPREPHPLFGMGGSLTLLPQAPLTFAFDCRSLAPALGSHMECSGTGPGAREVLST